MDMNAEVKNRREELTDNMFYLMSTLGKWFEERKEVVDIPEEEILLMAKNILATYVPLIEDSMHCYDYAKRILQMQKFEEAGIPREEMKFEMMDGLLFGHKDVSE